MLSKSLCVVIIAHSFDLFAQSVLEILEKKGAKTLHVDPSHLGDLRVTLQNDKFIVERREVAGILIRCSPDSRFSESFATQDRSFCDAEIGAIWLAAIQLKTVLAVNQFDALAWFEGAAWPIWRTKFLKAGIAVSPFGFGKVNAGKNWKWQPYKSLSQRFLPCMPTIEVLGAAVTPSSGVLKSTVVFNKAISGNLSLEALRAIKLLKQEGVQIAEIATDADGYVYSVNTLPDISGIEHARCAANIFIEQYHDHLRSR